MNEKMKISSLAFAIMKFRFESQAFHLMRRDVKWNDVNFIGGHVENKDNGDFERTTKRELREEVPVLRGEATKFVPLTSKLQVGPYFSKSAEVNVLYTVMFFQVIFLEDPLFALKKLRYRSRNRLVSEDALLTSPSGVSAMVSLLNANFAGGIHALEFSWQDKLPRISDFKGLGDFGQLDLEI